jgi:CTP synthase (UTP-ammonia lyase)
MPRGEDGGRTIRIALVGDFSPAVVAHRAIPLALALSGRSIGREVRGEWLHTADLARAGAESLASFAGVWCVPASPYADDAAALGAIRFARETPRPFLGTCGGFQYALVEYARNVLGMADADHAETAAPGRTLVISRLSCPLVEVTGRVHLRAGSTLRRIYAADGAEEGYHCSYGVNPQMVRMCEPPGRMRVAATDDAGEVRAIELDGHPFFIATLFQPERSGLKGDPHPLVTAFVAAAAGSPAV